jgi:hypothetical protein
MEQQIDTYIVHIKSASSRDSRGEEEEGDEEKEEELFQESTCQSMVQGYARLTGWKRLGATEAEAKSAWPRRGREERERVNVTTCRRGKEEENECRKSPPYPTYVCL